ncbi:hypothetical protein [Micromonospora rubida]
MDVVARGGVIVAAAGPLTPHKKPPGGDLTAKQKTHNYSLDRLPAPPRRV